MQDFLFSIQWRELLKEIVFMLVIIAVFHFWLPRSIVQGSSMEPNLYQGERLAASPLPYVLGEPQRGDIVMLYPVEENGPNLVKRILGLPGETVTFIRGELYVNGQRIEEPYLNEACRNCRTRVWVLGEDEFFILGDNRNVSRDSRAYGAIQRENIMAKVLFRWYPLNQMSLFRN
jgi:signal peptidase I